MLWQPVKQKKQKHQVSPGEDESTYSLQELKEKYGVSHQAVSGAIRATRSTRRQMLEEYLQKKRALKTRSRRYVQNAR